MQKGGAIDFSKPYKFITVNELNMDDLLATNIISSTSNLEAPTYAVLLVKEKTDVDNYDKVIGVSWYAIMKIINENPNKLDAFASKFFIKNSVGQTPDSTRIKCVIVGFIHGVHAYMLASGIENVPSLNDPIPVRYQWVINNLDKMNQANLTGIFGALYHEYMKSPPPDDITFNLLKTVDGLKKLLNISFEPQDYAIDTESFHDLDDVASMYSIHGILM